MRKFGGLLGAAALAAGVWAGAGRMAVEAQGRAGGPPAQTPAAAPAGPGAEWRTYGADLASTRYSPLDQINKDNFKDLEIAWRLNTNPFGARPDNLYSATPLMIKGTLYTTVGSRRGVAALDPGTGEIRWLHTEDEGVRGQNAPRNGSGRGVEYWSSADGRDERIIYVTPGYRMIALNAKTGVPVPTFGTGGVIDLKQDFDQKIDNLDTADVGLNATPLVVGDVVVVGAAHRFAGARGTNTVKGYVRAFDVRTGKRIWTFHTVPQKGEFGYDTWLNNSTEVNGNTGVWAQMSADPELGLVYLPVEMPPSDFFGGSSSGQHALRGEPRRRGHQDRQAQVALPDEPSRALGLGSPLCTDPVRHEHEWEADQGACPAHQDGLPLRAQPRNRRADLADRGDGDGGRGAYVAALARARDHDPDRRGGCASSLGSRRPTSGGVSGRPWRAWSARREAASRRASWGPRSSCRPCPTKASSTSAS